jgi:hypothetical protein
MVARVGEHEDDQLDPGIAPTEGDPPVESLPVANIRLGFDSSLTTLCGDHLIPSAWITSGPDRDLASPADARCHQWPEASKKADLTHIADSDSARKRSDRQVETHSRRNARRELDRQTRNAAVLDPAKVAVRDAASSRDTLLAQPGQAPGIASLSSELDDDSGSPLHADVASPPRGGHWVIVAAGPSPPIGSRLPSAHRSRSGSQFRSAVSDRAAECASGEQPDDV